jgi:SNF2 family DNA or RNA helicase
MAQVDRFQDDDSVPVFLISLKAGGTGLNLTAADVVVHFDPWWNPAAEAQASDRAHRIGQDKQVTVYKLITSGTVEENVLQLQQGKRKLLEQVFEESEAANLTLGVSDLRELI